MSETFVNKVAESGLISFNLEDFYPKNDVLVFDLKDFLFMGLILKEKDYRTALQNLDWEKYRNQNVTITCSADAVIPMWANMLAASYLQNVTTNIFFGNEQTAKEKILLKEIDAINANDYKDLRIIVKGCGDIAMPESAYVEITNKLRPVVKSLMFGEPCSTVPIYKRKEKQ
jgi:hypothetical protein